MAVQSVRFKSAALHETSPRPPPAAERVVVTITLAAGAELLEQTHKFIAEYTKQRYLPTVAQVMGVGAYELLSNACDYGSVSSEIVVELLESSSGIAVRVSNEAIPARIEMLQQHMKRLANGAEATYMEEMRRSMAGGVARAMLGLARVAHEAGLAIDVQVIDRKVIVTARRRR